MLHSVEHRGIPSILQAAIKVEAEMRRRRKKGKEWDGKTMEKQERGGREREGRSQERGEGQKRKGKDVRDEGRHMRKAVMSGNKKEGEGQKRETVGTKERDGRDKRETVGIKESGVEAQQLGRVDQYSRGGWQVGRHAGRKIMQARRHRMSGGHY